MSSRRRSTASRRLSWLLRHGAGETGLAMDAAGWAAIDDVLAVLSIDRPSLDDAVATNTKRRLQVDGPRIRACQGHSLEGTPVTLEALEASWVVAESDGSLWHGTNVAAVAGIAAEGIRPVRRTHVHLAPGPSSLVGKRAAVDLLLEVAPARLRAAGLGIFEAPNGVILVRRVPTAAIVGVRAETDRGRASLTAARDQLARD